ncbi:MAG: hypothetical protein NC205_01905 [Prevotella sp.]|nr:hypothetical protein [Alistipes senegalensis]MCM1357322.1 hypothetical protein [Prevotella sp.]MCM1472765.1 hypothetical protein [Muribaculaceae bacterium]
MNKKALMAATAAILALSAVSCGKDDGESSVSIAYGESTKTTVTEEAEEKTTKTVSDTKTTAATTEISGTETTTTTTDTGEEISSETTTSAESSEIATTATTVPAETTSPAETTTQAITETPTEENTPAPDDNNDNNNNNNDNNNDTPPAITLAPETPEPATEIRTENNTFDFKFTIDNLLNDASGLLAMLGTPDYSGEAPGCTSNGNDVKIYQYDGLEIQCYIDGSTEYIFSIEITNDKYITDHNIKTGSTRAEVESAYGTGETSGNMTVYYTGNNEMDIEYNGDTVTSIFFYAPV